MVKLGLRFDMRAPAFGTEPAILYAAMLEMAGWADKVGFSTVRISEHHGVEDGYLPSPLVAAAAISARTRNMRISIAALVLPLHDPIDVAEQVAVLDLLSGGRVDLTIAAGYVASEFQMFGVAERGRAKRVKTGIDLLRRAWSGESFEHDGRTVRVTPRPLQQPHPPLWLGGSTPAAAKRAARLGIGFDTHIAELHRVYCEEARQIGFTPSSWIDYGPMYLHVTRDPEAAWATIAPHAIYETNEYGRWAAAAGVESAYSPVRSADELRRTGAYAVLTPEQCVAMAKGLGSQGMLLFHPLMAGLDPEFSWQSLRLFEKEVLPCL
jgi:alkanesulfonate monooxygenase SsuD/methylene tetrahydromethanopterin reductase-like flavin-dependent oxidoreductase (luciferase family)